MANSLEVRDVYALMNQVVSEATGRTDLSVVDTSSFISVGETLLRTSAETTLNAISTVLAKTIFSVRPYKSRLESVRIAQERWGGIVRKVVNLYTEAEASKDWNTNINPSTLADGNSVDMYEILKNHDMSKSGIILHSFNGDVKWLNRFLDLGLWISYSGVVSFKNAPEVHESAKNTPLDRLLVETDAPYLTPEPYRGHSNQPAYTRYVVDAIAKYKDISPDEVAEHTFKNAHKVYNL